MDGGDNPLWAGGVSFGFTEVGCVEGVFVGFEIATSGRPASTCDESLYEAPDSTLEYGEQLAVGDITCMSQTFGMTCLNSVGNGFRIATHEIAMLYSRAPGWQATSSSTAPERLVPRETTALEESSKLSNEAGSVVCYLARYDFLDPALSFVECRSTGEDAWSGAEWSPDGRSCAGADFNGYYLDDAQLADSYRVATFGCTTDVTPLSDPREPVRTIATGEAVVLGGITCLSTGPAIACHNLDGNGMLIAGDEVSFFYSRGS